MQKVLQLISVDVHLTLRLWLALWKFQLLLVMKVVMEKIQNGDIVIIDGLDGEVIVNPSEETLRSFEEKKAKFEEQKLNGQN